CSFSEFVNSFQGSKLAITRG
ncbi:hypothetical protein K1719_046299, partial [Acacia pycnantha]